MFTLIDQLKYTGDNTWPMMHRTVPGEDVLHFIAVTAKCHNSLWAPQHEYTTSSHDFINIKVLRVIAKNLGEFDKPKIGWFGP